MRYGKEVSLPMGPLDPRLWQQPDPFVLLLLPARSRAEETAAKFSQTLHILYKGFGAKSIGLMCTKSYSVEENIHGRTH